ncbi:TRAP transporter substrate-binding protein [Spongorhabdus nitratireducens]
MQQQLTTASLIRNQQVMLLIACLLFVADALAAKRLTLKMAHNLNQHHTVHRAAVFMDEQLNQMSEGMLRLRIYPGSQMGDATDTLQMVQQGVLDMTKCTASDLESFDRTFAVFNLPYLFENREHFNNVVYGPLGREIMQAPAKKGFIAIAAYEAGTRSFYARKPIRTPDDLKGMKIRVQPSPTTIEMIRLMGGAPVPVPFGETYTALQQGVVDMAENNAPSYVDTRHYEVARYFSEDEHTSIPDYLIISVSSWKEKLSDQQRTMLQTAAERSEAYQRQLWNDAVQQARNTARKAGVSFIEVNKKPFRDAIAPLYQKFSRDPEQAKLLQRIRTTGTPALEQESQIPPAHPAEAAAGA